jgi:RNA polymerase sigma factor (sigma-70 family)
LDVSLLFDRPEPEQRGPAGIDPELPGENYFETVNAIPLLNRAEANELIQRWQKFRDEKARARVIEAHLRMPPAIARKAARRFEPNKHMMSGLAVVDAWKGHRALVEELTAEGNLALVESVESFKPDKGFAFATYAGKSIKNAVNRRLRSFSSVVDRPFGKRTPTDIYIDPGLPDFQSPDDYCGGRARKATPSDDDEREEGQALPGKYKRLTPWPKPNEGQLCDSYLKILPDDQARVINLRRVGLKHREVADELGISTSTAWRLEQTALEQMRALWNSTRSSFRETRAADLSC